MINVTVKNLPLVSFINCLAWSVVIGPEGTVGVSAPGVSSGSCPGPGSMGVKIPFSSSRRYFFIASLIAFSVISLNIY